MFLAAFGVQIPVVLSATRRIPTMRLPSLRREMKLAAMVDSQVLHRKVFPRPLWSGRSSFHWEL